MKAKRLTTILLFIAALGLGAFVIYENQSQQNQNERQIQEYLNEGTEQGGNGTTSIQLGVEAPDFSLPVYEGEADMMSLSQHRGDFVIINLWASWCKPCTDEIPHFIQFYEEYEEDNVEILGVNMTSTESNHEVIYRFLEDFPINYPVLLDEDGQVYDDYRVYGLPMTFFIDPDGYIANSVMGYVSYDRLVSMYDSVVEEYEGR
ncbi:MULTISPECIES: peroxiredoxin family protein [Bacillaceae]|uniref:TlpA family protein disulfide reductase n=1 Tax=Evansella alkalicola TaxID=745819 RepID=A0ABS6K076_9BACI|nr:MULTISPECIES: TlpA disulfide reductase family protein [Bacillaceae]MBU9724045.1 TlpA family protein disulfide reductase [Bacillus alkalicola]